MNNPFETIEARLSNIECLILDLKHSKITASDNDRWLSMNDLCEYLPGHPVKATIYGKVQRRELPHKKIGKRLAFRKSEIDNWLASQGRKTVSEIAASSGTHFVKRKGGNA